MKKNEFNSLQKGNKVRHKRYGIMTVVDFIPDFGPTLTADDKSGCELLSEDSGMPFGTPFLEDSPREIQILKER
jgi:hypothetical protein